MGQIDSWLDRHVEAGTVADKTMGKGTTITGTDEVSRAGWQV